MAQMRRMSDDLDARLAEQLQHEEMEDDGPLFKGPPMRQRTLTQMSHEKHGGKVFDEFKGKKKIDSQAWGHAYRVQPQKHAFGGSGQDEMISTAWTRDHIADMQKAGVPEDVLKAEIQKLSGVRVNTDALAWRMADGELGGHPGALRSKPKSNSPIVGDHNLRDAARAAALKTEFKDIVPDASKTTVDDFQLAHKRVVVRAQLETVARFSQPQEQFAQQGEVKQKAFHTRFGDIRKKENYGKMADYVHDERERIKWEAAHRMMEDKDLEAHVPQEYAHYIKQGGDQVQGRRLFDEAVAAGRQGYNSAPSSQAHLPAGNQTLRGRAATASSSGQRALSPPRQRRKP